MRPLSAFLRFSVQLALSSSCYPLIFIRPLATFMCHNDGLARLKALASPCYSYASPCCIWGFLLVVFYALTCYVWDSSQLALSSCDPLIFMCPLATFVIHRSFLSICIPLLYVGPLATFVIHNDGQARLNLLVSPCYSLICHAVALTSLCSYLYPLLSYRCICSSY